MFNVPVGIISASMRHTGLYRPRQASVTYNRLGILGMSLTAVLTDNGS